jgi:hypothetical protein
MVLAAAAVVATVDMVAAWWWLRGGGGSNALGQLSPEANFPLVPHLPHYCSSG